MFHFYDNSIEEVKVEKCVSDKATDTFDLGMDPLKSRETNEEHTQFITSLKEIYPTSSKQNEIMNVYNSNPVKARELYDIHHKYSFQTFGVSGFIAEDACVVC